MFVEVGPSSERALLSPQGKCPKPAHSLSKVLQPSEVALLDPMLKTTGVGPSGRVASENNLPLLCNPALGWSAPPRQPPGDKAHALGQRPEPGGRPRVGPSWKRDKSRAHGGPSVSQEWKARWYRHETTNRAARRGARGLSPGFGVTCHHQRIRNLYFGNLAAGAGFFVFSVIISLLFSLSI